MRFLVVLPTYNEAENVLPLAREVLSQDPRIDVLVVDDASPDGTGDLVAAAERDEPRLGLLRRTGKLGLGTAYLAGFRHGLEQGYEFVLTMDCDFSHNPRYLPDLLAASGDFDLVIGSRYVPGGGIANWPLHRRLLSSFANSYTRVLLRLPTRDCTSGFRCYRREVLETVDPFAVRSSGYSFLEEMVWRVSRAGFRIGETPILFEDRRRGSSKISKREIWRAAAHVLGTALRPPPFAGPAGPAERAARAAREPGREA
jgi:dolichol-phosphate mannosyltransferase